MLHINEWTSYLTCKEADICTFPENIECKKEWNIFSKVAFLFQWSIINSLCYFRNYFTPFWYKLMNEYHFLIWQIFLVWCLRSQRHIYQLVIQVAKKCSQNYQLIFYGTRPKLLQIAKFSTLLLVSFFFFLVFLIYWRLHGHLVNTIVSCRFQGFLIAQKVH